MKKQKICSYNGADVAEVVEKIRKDSEFYFQLPVKTVSLTANPIERNSRYSAIVVFESEEEE